MKRIVRIVVLGVAFGGIMLLLQGLLHLETSQTLHLMLVIGAVAVIVALAVNIMYNLRYAKEMQRIAPLLETGQPEKYIAELEKLLQTAKGQNLRLILRVNLAAGLLEAKRFEEAWSLLTELSEAKFSTSELRLCQRLNWCMSSFYTGRTEKALQIQEESQTLFNTWHTSPEYGGSIVVVEILASFFRGQKDQALRQLEQARKDWTSPRMKASLEDLEGFLQCNSL